MQAPTTFWRNASAGVLVLIGVLLVSLSVSAIWLNRTIMIEDRWVATLAPLAQDTSIQDWVAKSTTDAIFANVDIQGYVEQAIQPLSKQVPQVAILASPITGAIQNLIRDASVKVVRSDQFAQIWEKTLRLSHKAFIVAISDKQSGAITKSGGTVTLDISVLVDQVKVALTDKGLGFVNSINLPIASEQITLVDSQALADLSTAIRLMNTMAWVLPVLAIALLAGGVAVAANRRKAVMWMGIGIIALTVIPVQAIYLGQVPFSRMALELANMPSAAAQAAYGIIFANLIKANQFVSVGGSRLLDRRDLRRTQQVGDGAAKRLPPRAEQHRSGLGLRRRRPVDSRPRVRHAHRRHRARDRDAAGGARQDGCDHHLAGRLRGRVARGRDVLRPSPA